MNLHGAKTRFEQLFTTVTKPKPLKALCCCGALVLGYTSFKLCKKYQIVQHVSKYLSKLHNRNIYYLKTKYHLKILLIELIPTSYYIVLPHILHQTILCSQALYLYKNNIKHLKYMTSANYMQYATLYSFGYY